MACGFAFASVTLLIAGWSASFLVGLIVGAVLLGVGTRFGLRRLPYESEAWATDGPSVTPQTQGQMSLNGVGLAVAGAGAASLLALGFAYLMERLGNAADLGVELGIVSLVTTGFCFIYAGLLQLALGGRR